VRVRQGVPPTSEAHSLILSHIPRSSDKTLKVWDTVEKQCLHTFTDYEDQVWGVDWDRTGTYIAGVSDDHTIRIHECPSS
jgi:WD repeat-containing protein 61